MNIIAPRITEEGIKLNQVYEIRETVRAIILNKNNEVLMCYSKMFDDYTFPGGGIDLNESKEEALLRELKEEIGAYNVSILKVCGQIEELKYNSLENQNIYLQVSTYFACDIKSLGKQKLMAYEKVHGLEPVWVKIDDVIEKNRYVLKDENHQKKGLKTTLIREIEVLKYVKEHSKQCVNSK